MIYLYLLIPAVTAQSFSPKAKLSIPVGIPVNKAKAKIEAHL